MKSAQAFEKGCLELFEELNTFFHDAIEAAETDVEVGRIGAIYLKHTIDMIAFNGLIVSKKTRKPSDKFVREMNARFRDMLADSLTDITLKALDEAKRNGIK